MRKYKKTITKSSYNVSVVRQHGIPKKKCLTSKKIGKYPIPVLFIIIWDIYHITCIYTYDLEWDDLILNTMGCPDKVTDGENGVTDRYNHTTDTDIVLPTYHSNFVCIKNRKLREIHWIYCVLYPGITTEF